MLHFRWLPDIPHIGLYRLPTGYLSISNWMKFTLSHSADDNLRQGAPESWKIPRTMFLPSADASFGQCLQELMNIQCPTWISRKRLVKAPGEWAWTFTCVRGAFNRGKTPGKWPGVSMQRSVLLVDWKSERRMVKVERVNDECEELKMRGPKMRGPSLRVPDPKKSCFGQDLLATWGSNGLV